MSTVPALADVTASNAALRRFLHGLPGVDAVGLEARAATLSTRSIKTSAKAYAIDLAISMVDLTTLEGADTPGKVRNLVRKGLLPDPERPDTPRVAAICIYPDLSADRRPNITSTTFDFRAIFVSCSTDATSNLHSCASTSLFTLLDATRFCCESHIVQRHSNHWISSPAPVRGR